MSETIPGYDYGMPTVATSPVTLAELDLLLKTVLFTPEDARWLRRAGEVLADRVDEVLDTWYGFVGSHPHLVQHFADRQGQPHAGYLAAVRRRFGQWIRDTCQAEYNQPWLDYQQEIALRHTAVRKNCTDGVDAKTAEVPLRYLIAFIYPITATVKPFLAESGLPGREVDRMHEAWFKAIVLQAALWSQPYIRAESL